MQLRTSRDIGNLIKAQRLAMRMSQSELAKRVGVSRLWVVQTERGNPGASLDLILRTMTALGVTLTASDYVDSNDVPIAERPPPVEGPDIGAIMDALRRA